MKPYKIYPPEKKSFQDRKSGVTVWQLTDYKGHSEHPYFTDDGWYDDDRRMLFVSDSSYCNIYMTAIPADFDALPPLEL